MKDNCSLLSTYNRRTGGGEKLGLISNTPLHSSSFMRKDNLVVDFFSDFDDKVGGYYGY